MYIVWRICFAAVSYKKLWKPLKDKDVKKKDPGAKTGISLSYVTKMGRNVHFAMESFGKYTALKCQAEDTMETVPDNQ